PRGVPGEVFQLGAVVNALWQTSVFGSAALEWRPLPAHALRLASTVRYSSRTGDEKASNCEGVNVLAGTRTALTLVSGLEYELNAFDLRPAGERAEPSSNVSRDRRLQNLFFVKHYYHSAALSQGYDLVRRTFEDSSTDAQRFGVGDGLRFRFTDSLSAKV